MKPVAFDELARMPLLQHYEEAFHKATGVSLKLVPPEEPQHRLNYGRGENDFCSLVGSTPAGCDACLEAQVRIQRSTTRKLVTQQIYCFAGLTEVAVPVMIGGRHVATLMSGQVFRREPTQRDFEMVVKMLGGGPDRDWEKKARKAYFETPVISVDRLQAIIQLLTVFARHLSDDASRHSIACSDREPGAVSSAKKFIQSHAEAPITLGQVLQHVHVSRFYFCKIFKKATGMTLTEYVARVRVEKAKTLLVDPSASPRSSLPRASGPFRASTACSSVTSGCRRRNIGTCCARSRLIESLWRQKPPRHALLFLPTNRQAENANRQVAACPAVPLQAPKAQVADCSSTH